MKLTEKAYVILVNWRNPYDTIECIESLLNQNYPAYQIVVCENGSADSSLEIFKAWASGNLCIAPNKNSPGARYAQQPPERSSLEAEFVQAIKVENTYTVPLPSTAQVNSNVVFIEIPENTGFAGGNNVGLRYALANNDGQYFWVLNNDTVVAPDALMHLVKKTKINPSYAMVGATVYHYDQPTQIQYSCGATANRWLATVRPVIEYPVGEAEDAIRHLEDFVEKQVSYVVGASMLLTRDFLKKVGLISEDYFLYYEEQDWVARMPKEMKIGYSSLARVYHKEGASIGAKTVSKVRKSRTAEYYSSRSRIIYTKRFYYPALIFVICALLGGMLNRARNGYWSNIFYMAAGMLCGLKSSCVAFPKI